MQDGVGDEFAHCDLRVIHEVTQVPSVQDLSDGLACLAGRGGVVRESDDNLVVGSFRPRTHRIAHMTGLPDVTGRNLIHAQS